MTRKILHFVLGFLIFACVAFSQQTVTYGSSVKLHSLANGKKFYLAAVSMQWHGRPQDHDIVSAMSDETRAEVYWNIISSSSDNSRLSAEPVLCGAYVRFRQAVSGKHLHSERTHKAPLSGLTDVAAAGSDSPDSDFLVDCKSPVWLMNQPVTLKHRSTGGYLGTSADLEFTQYNCPRCPMIGDLEVSLSAENRGRGWIVSGGVIIHELKDASPNDPEEQFRDEL